MSSVVSFDIDGILSRVPYMWWQVKSTVRSAEKDVEGADAVGGGGKGLKALLNGLDELWDQSQYTEEYNLSQFLSRLNG